MKILILIICFSCFSKESTAQEKSNATILQFGLGVNFLRQVDQEYTGGLGGGTAYELSNLDPLPGFVLGVNREITFAKRFFFKTGAMLSYHVNGAVMNSHSWVMGYPLNQKENIKTNFRDLYIQLPADFGISIGEKKLFSIYCGLKVSFLLINGSKWQYMITQQNYDFSHWPPTFLDESNPTEEETKPAIYPRDVAIELGFMQKLSNRFVLEERVYKGLVIIGDFLKDTEAGNIKQTTLEVALGIRLNR